MTAVTLGPGWVERPPLGEGEVARWRYRVANGATVDVVLAEHGGRRRVRWSTGPGACMPETTDHADLYLAGAGLMQLGDWLAQAEAPAQQPASPETPEPEDLTLFDEVPA